MSVQLKIFVACLGFIAIIAALGGLARQQVGDMSRLAIGIYDHAYMGTLYVDQAQAEFLRLAATHQAADATLADPAGHAAVQKVLDRLDVALERATSAPTIAAGGKARAALAALPDAPAGELAQRMAQADATMVKLVKRFTNDGLATRDEAETLASDSARLVLIGIGGAVGAALAVGYLLGRNLSRPLVQLVAFIGRLAAGELQHDVPAKLKRRRDEIGMVARAMAVFREAMARNANADVERERERERGEAEKAEALRATADKIVTESRDVTARSAEGSALLAARAADLAASAARVLASVGAASQASNDVLVRSERAASAGTQLSASAREIAQQIANTAAEVASTARAGEHARGVIDQLSGAVGQIGTVARLIGGIAARTNLLALNAGIEAARAGDAGRGFAVVASEVKSLAAQTARSTAEIAANVNAIEQTTREAVQAVGEMVARVAAIERITRTIAAATDQQTQATGDIAHNIAGATDAMRAVSGQITVVSQEAHATDTAVSEMQELAGTVSTRVNELRDVMVRVVRAASDAADQRATKRVELNEACKVVINGRVLPATCIDLSAGGARVALAEQLADGTRVVLQLSGLADLPAQVVNVGRHVGLRFDWAPAEAPAGLRARLALPQAA